MALPQQVVEQLSQETRRTPGWSFGVILFSGGILLIVLAVFAGLRYGYEPYLNGQISSLKAQVDQLGQSVTPAEEANLVTFYSQISNLQSLVKGHVYFSQFLAWLENHTEANIYYTNMTYTQNHQVTLAGIAKTPADVSEQVAIFEASRNITSLSLANVTYSQSPTGWIFNMILTLNPALLTWQSATTTPATATVPPSAALPAATSSATLPSSATSTAPAAATTTP